MKSTIIFCLFVIGLSAIASVDQFLGLPAFARNQEQPANDSTLFIALFQHPNTTERAALTPTATPSGTMLPSTVIPTDTPTVIPTGTPTSTLTATATTGPEPQPCNQVATDLILQVSELVEGFSVREEGSMTLDPQTITLGAIDSYTVTYANAAQLLLGTSGIRSDVIVFLTEAGAQSYLAASEAAIEADPALEAIDVPAYGDESGAFKSTLVESGVDFTAYTIYIRQNNIGTTVSTAALPSLDDLEVTKALAEIAVAKICTD
ncbi:MAG: hypothetical protein AAF702_41010 [Chloroflexota bacterium]